MCETSYLIGSFAHFILEGKDTDCVPITNLFSSTEHLKYLHELYSRLIDIKNETARARVLSASFVTQMRIPDDISSKAQVLSFTCATSVRNPTQFFKDLANSEDQWAFVAGMIDSTSRLEMKEDDLHFAIFCANKRCLLTVAEFINVPFLIKELGSPLRPLFQLQYSSTNLLDVLGNTNLKKHSRVRCNDFLSKLSVSFLPFRDCKVYLTDPNAIMPTKAHFSDVGFDLTLIRKSKEVGSRTTLFDTGLVLEIPFGFYAELVPRSSLSKTGYVLSNSVGIIDRSYRGNLLVSLTKVEEDKPDVVLPFRAVQLIFKRQEWIPLMFVPQVTPDATSKTTRGTGGFGSS